MIENNELLPILEKISMQILLSTDNHNKQIHELRAHISSRFTKQMLLMEETFTKSVAKVENIF